MLLHLRKKDKPFAVVDTHAGRGLYDIASAEAQKTGEAADGVGRLSGRELPDLLRQYLTIAQSFGEGRYPGSPLIAARMLRPQDRLIAVEYQQVEYDELRRHLAICANARVIAGDGYRELPRLLPPRERRGVVLIDPPYEDEAEFANAATAIVAAHRRFATGIYMLWYPAKERPQLAATAGELLNAGITALLRLDLDVGARGAPQREGRGPPMTATGLLVVNPPFGFADEIRVVLAFLQEALAQGAGASSSVEVLAKR